MSDGGRSPGAGRRGLLGCALLALCLAAGPLAAQETRILPADFFSRIPAEAGQQMAIAANRLIVDITARIITAEGRIGLNYAGYRASGDRVVYYQDSGRVEIVGNVGLVDPDGIEYTAERVALDGGFRTGFLQSLAVSLPDGTIITAAETEFTEAVEAVFRDGLYSPCGTCIDEQGRRIGWQVRAATVIVNDVERTVYFEEPRIELLGVPIAQLSYLSFQTDQEIEFPVIDYNDRFGLRVSFPFFSYRMAGGTLALTPTLFSRQGLMLGARWRQDIGVLDYEVGATGIYQLDPGAYAGEVGERGFRGALQTSGTFTPSREWTLGWSYTAFTDAGYLPDYKIASDRVVNEAFARYLTPETFGDIRVQQFWQLGNITPADQERQATTLPNARLEHVVELDDEAGRVAIAGRLLGLSRLRDHVADVNGVPYVFGYEGEKIHGMVQAGWSRQWILPYGVAATPYLGLRADAGYHSGASSLLPGEETLFTATPIAALDIRYPLVGRSTGVTHVVEPIGQIVYRASDTSLVGVTNDDAQSFIFDDTNLFSFNRFSAYDRQETGLRANVGGAYLASFDSGDWVQAILGQSYHLAGTNALGQPDHAQTGRATGLHEDASYIVAGIAGSIGPVLTVGGKIQFDPYDGTVPRAGLMATGAIADYRLSANYLYIDAEPALGVFDAQNEIALAASAPIADYWAASAGVAWDLNTQQWLEVSAGLNYDDRYLAFGAAVTRTGPTHHTPNDTRVQATFLLRNAGAQEIVGLRN